MKLYTVVFLVAYTTLEVQCGGILFPQESETREVKSLDGIWNFWIPPTNNSHLKQVKLHVLSEQF